MARRLLLVSQPTVDGVAVCVRQLAEIGMKAGFDVTVACPDDGDLAGWVVASGARWEPLRMRRQPSPTDTAIVSRLRRLARGADVVHLHSSKAGAAGRLAMLGLRQERPGVAFTPHGLSWYVGGAMARVYRSVERTLAPAVDAIVTVSHEERDAARLVLGEAPIRVIENAVDTRHFSPDGPRADRSDEPLIVCVGRLREEKGQDVAIRALAAMRTNSARLRFVGDGPSRATFSALATRLGVGGRVEWTGKVADPAPHIRAADVVVVPSRYEGMSLALLESMAAGACIVTTAVNGSSAARGVASVVPTEDEWAMALAIDDLLADPEQAAALGRAAAARAAAQYDITRYAAEHVALWTELAAVKHAAGHRTAARRQ